MAVEQAIVEREAGATRTRRWAFAGSAVFAWAVAVLAPLPYGGVYNSWLVVQIVAASLALACLALSAGRGSGAEWRVAALACAVPAIVAVTLGLQHIVAARFASPVWSGLPIAVDPLAQSSRGAGMVELGQAIAFALALLCGHAIARGGLGLRALRAFGYAGALYALLALGYEFLAPDRLLLTEKRAYLGYLTTPFVTRNTAATFYGSIAVVLALFVARARLGRSARGVATADVVALASVALALALTGSRAGIVLSALACIAAYLATTRGFARRRGRSRLVWIAAAGIPVLIGMMILSERFADETVIGGGRAETYAAVARMIAERPLLGWGIGTFADVFPSFRDGSTRGIWDRAHSTPLEWAAEGGLPFALAMLGVLGGFLALTARLFVQARGPYMGEVRREPGLSQRPLAAFLVLALGLTHSLIDFSLDITGYLVPCAFLIGLGTSAVPGAALQAYASRAHPRERARMDEGAFDGSASEGEEGLREGGARRAEAAER